MEQVLTMDSAVVCEFKGTKNAEKNATNAQVANFFEETFIRFPFKDN